LLFTRSQLGPRGQGYGFHADPAADRPQFSESLEILEDLLIVPRLETRSHRAKQLRPLGVYFLACHLIFILFLTRDVKSLAPPHQTDDLNSGKTILYFGSFISIIEAKSRTFCHFTVSKDSER
jgi:hypothetical protein